MEVKKTHKWIVRNAAAPWERDASPINAPRLLMAT